MKRRTRSFLVFILVLILVSSCLFCCKQNADDPQGTGTGTNDTTKLPDGTDSEVVEGVYYYSAGNNEYLLTLNSNLSVTLLIDGEMKAGSYTLQGTTLTLTMDGENAPISATYSADVVTLNYNGGEYRYLKRVSYTVTFQTNGGSAIESVQVINGKPAQKPEDPTLEGSAFIGWYTDAALTTPYAFGSEMITADITLYARWAAYIPGLLDFTVQFDLNYEGAGLMDETAQTVGGKLYNAPTPVREGYTFKGWFVSDNNDANQLTYLWEEDRTFNSDTTLFAVWEKNEASSKLSTPVVNILSNGTIRWDAVRNATNYKVEIIDPTGNVTTKTEISTSTTYDFATAPAGDYIIRVTAQASSEANNSDAAERFYKNKALARVSHFSVVDSNLLFSGVENAEKYLITVKCGNPAHKHNSEPDDNGTSTTFFFGNCDMKEGGIEFTVTAVAEGYASSTSAVFCFERVLDAVANFNVDAATETLTWDAVPAAEGYVITVKYGTTEFTVELGNQTSYCFKELAPADGNISVSVVPKAKGYNSPEASAYALTKQTPATPVNIALNGTVLTWDAVAGATGYEVMINNQTVAATTNQLDLTAYATGAAGSVYNVKVLAVKGNLKSLYSDEYTIANLTMETAPWYAAGAVNWNPVLGATGYQIQLNGEVIATVDANQTSATVAFTKAGNNTVTVSPMSGNDVLAGKTVDVVTYEISFDPRGGAMVNSLYLAKGDPTDSLPVAARTGYTFQGWYNAPGGAAENASKYTDATYNAEADMMLYAYWSANEITVTYNYSIGSGTHIKDTVVFGEEFKLEVPVVTDDSNQVLFKGWFSASDGRGIQYTDETGKGLFAWNDAGDVTLYAYFQDLLRYTEITDAATGEVSYSIKLFSYSSLNSAGIKTLTVPATHDGKRVSVVEGYAFRYSNLETITIPNSVTIIEGTAFQSCKYLTAVYISDAGYYDPAYYSVDGVLIHNDPLTKETELVYYPVARAKDFVIPEGITVIPAKTFASSAITAVTLPSTLIAIYDQAFNDCKNLKTITFAPTAEGTDPVALTLYKEVFRYCTALTAITLPARLAEFDTTIFSYCTALAYVDVEAGNATYSSVNGVVLKNQTTLFYCPIARAGAYTIPVGVTTIGEKAFSRCTLITELTIPYFVTTIEKYAFEYCSGLVKLTFRGSEDVSALTIPDYAFQYCSKLTDVVFEEGSNVTTINQYAFRSTGLVEITLPATLTTLAKYSFSSNSNLTTVRFDNNPTGKLTMADYAFSSCTKLESVYFPVQVSTVNATVFNGCTALSNYFVDEANTSMSDINGVVYSKDKTVLKLFPLGKSGAYVIPDGVKEVDAKAFYNNANLTSITIGKDVTKIGNQSFYGCKALTEVIFTEGRTAALTLGTQMFYNCTALENITVPETLTAIPDNCFYGCTSLTEFVFHDKLVSIGAYAFRGTSLPAIELPASVKSVGNYAFSYNKSLTSATLLNGVTYGTYVFGNCDNLVSATVEPGVTAIPNQTFASCTLLEKIFVPNTVTSIGLSAFANDRSLIEVVFEEGGTAQLSISGTYTFANCTGLVEIHFPGRLNSLGNNTFSGCTALVKVTLGTDSQLTSLGTSAFNGCTALEEFDLTVCSKLTSIGTQAFYNCYALKEIFIPGSVTTMGSTAATNTSNIFYQCKALERVTFGDAIVEEGKEDTPLALMSCFFAYCSALKEVHFGNHVKSMIQITFGNLSTSRPTALETVTAEGNAYMVVIDGILYRVDEDGNPVEIYLSPALNPNAVIDLPATLTVPIAKFTFAGNVNLVSIRIPTTLASIGQYAFSGCTGLTEVEFYTPAGTTSSLVNIGDYCFQNASALKKIAFPDSVIRLGRNTFSGCTSLTSITLPASLSYLKTDTKAEKINDVSDTFYPLYQNAFSGCTALEEFIISDEAANYKTIDGVLFFKNTDGLTLIFYPPAKKGASYTIPEGTVAITIADSTHAFMPSTSSADVRGAFYRTQYLESLVIPAYVQTVNGYTFYETVKLRYFEIADGRTEPLTFKNNGTYGYIFCQVNSLEEVVIASDKVVFTDYMFGYKYKTTYFQNLKKVTFTSGPELTALPNYMFYYSTLETVVLSEYITEIGNYTFGGCTKLTNIDFINQITKIGTNAFEGTSITELFIPKTLTDIGIRAFKECRNLTKVEFEEGNTITVLPDYIFDTCTNLTSLKLCSSIQSYGPYSLSFTGFPTFVIPEGFDSVPQSLFMNNSALQSVTLPSTLKSIGDMAFQRSGITEIVIPEGVTTIGKDAFNDCPNLTKVVLPSTLKSLGTGVFQSCPKLEVVVLPDLITAIPDTLFKACTGLKMVVIPDGVTSIGANAFNGTTSLQSIILPDSLTTIGSSAFAGMTSLETMIIPDSVTTIGSQAFSGCTNLKSVSLPKNLQYLGGDPAKSVTLKADGSINKDSNLSTAYAVFQNCTSLERVTFAEETKISAPYFIIGKNTFLNCSSLKEIYLPEGTTHIMDSAFSGCTNLTMIEIPNDVAQLGTSVFKDCKSLISLYIPANVVVIGNTPFSGCTALASIDLAPANTAFHMADNALYNEDSTTLICYPAMATGDVVISNSVTSITSGAFAYSLVTSVTLPDTLTTVAANMFEGCPNLKTVILPSTIKTIGASAFKDSAIESIELTDEITSIGASAFRNSKIKSIYIGNKVSTISDYAFRDCTELKDVTFGHAGTYMLKLGYYAFSGCTSIEEITLPRRIRDTSGDNDYTHGIGSYAFRDCTSLKSVEFSTEGANKYTGSSQLTLGSYAFAGCVSLTDFAFAPYMRNSRYHDSNAQKDEIVSVVSGYCFDGCVKLANVTFEIDKTVLEPEYSFDSYAFRGCISLKQIDLPQLTIEIGAGAFTGTGLESIVIPAAVTTIGTTGYLAVGAFQDCKSLTSVTFENKDTFISVGANTFKGCTALKTISLPKGMTTIYDGFFEGCTALTELVIPAKVTTINARAFAGCTGIKSITIPKKVTNLKASVFEGWTSAQTINLEISKNEIPRFWEEGWDADCEAVINWKQ